MELPQTILDVVKHFSRLQGIGEKSALRHTLFLTKLPKTEIRNFSQALLSLQNIKNCTQCGMLSDHNLCEICQNPTRSSQKILCIVENFVDCLAIEKSGHYEGLFHVLGGVLNPLLGVGPDELNLDHLFNRIKEKGFEEIILAINPSVEGDATCAYIKSHLAESINVERIGFGIPMGGSLEYLDSITISKALENRRKM